MKCIICRQLPDSPPPQQGASDPFSRLTALVYVYTFSTQIYFLPKSTSFPQKNNHNAPINFAIFETGNQGSSSLQHVWLFNLFCFSEEGKDTTGQTYQLRI